MGDSALFLDNDDTRVRVRTVLAVGVVSGVLEGGADRLRGEQRAEDVGPGVGLEVDVDGAADNSDCGAPRGTAKVEV